MACVDIDNPRNGRRSAMFLRSKEHRRIALVAESEEWMSGSDFAHGFREAVQSDDSLAGMIRQVVPTFENARAAAADMLSGPTPPTAIVATTALTVFGVLEAVTRTAQAVTVLGISSPLLNKLHPNICRIVSPIHEMGKEMTAALIEVIETGQASMPWMLQSDILDERGAPYREEQSL
jgi:LacI family transcriptional regulator